MFGELLVLPSRKGSAAENMATDTALLETFPHPQALRFRHYTWQGDCYTFGYSQHFASVKNTCPQKAIAVRRPTGGGIVDHRNDWTYALVIPFAHPLCRAKASESYVVVHQALCHAFIQCGISARLALCNEAAKGPLPDCFMAPAPGDVVDDDGLKMAGAAQKRNRHGLLIQGSVDPRGRDFDALGFGDFFVAAIAEKAGVSVQPWNASWQVPAALLERYQSQNWNQSR